MWIVNYNEELVCEAYEDEGEYFLNASCEDPEDPKYVFKTPQEAKQHLLNYLNYKLQNAETEVVRLTALISSWNEP